jgi:hypothetical protein
MAVEKKEIFEVELFNKVIAAAQIKSLYKVEFPQIHKI